MRKNIISAMAVILCVFLIVRNTAADEDLSDPDRKIEKYTNAIKQNPKDSTAYAGRGAAYQEKGELEKALADFNNAIKLNPADADAYVCRGRLFSEKGDFAGAVKDFSSAIEIDPKCDEAYDNRGLAYSRQGDDEKAVKEFTKAMQIDADYPFAYLNRGMSLHKLKKIEQAIEDYDACLKIMQARLVHFTAESKMYQQKGHYEESLHKTAQAILWAERISGLLVKRGDAHAELGNDEKAVKDYTLAVASPESRAHEAYIKRGWLYYKMGKHKEAVQDMTSAVNVSIFKEKEERASCYVQRADMYLLLEQEDKAKSDLETAIELYPDCEKARKKLDELSGNK